MANTLCNRSGPFTDRINNDSLTWVPAIRAQLLAGNLTAAGNNTLTYMANQNVSSPRNVRFVFHNPSGI